MSSSVRVPSDFKIGDVIRGRWNGRVHRVIRPLGKGANGSVYLVSHNGRNFAMKVAEESHGIALEFRLLKQMQQFALHAANGVRELRLGPFVYELDDFLVDKDSTVFFYIMEYIAGVSVNTYINTHGKTGIPLLIDRLLLFLQQLHALNYAFGDMKAENVLVNPLNGEVRLVDFGGITRFEEGIRQYTEWNDRACWGAGMRKAEPSYDLFAVAMLLTQLLGAGTTTAQTRDISELRQTLQTNGDNRVWMPLLEKAWRGAYNNAGQMRRDVAAVKQISGRQSLPGNSITTKVRAGLLREWDWSDWTVIASMVLCLSLFLRLLMVQ